MGFDSVGWASTLRERGLAIPEAGLTELGSGMEGTVVGLGDGLVAKIWHHPDADRLARRRVFHDALAAAVPGFAVSRVLGVVEHAGHVATIEQFLPGRPLRDTMGEDTPAPTDRDVTAVSDVLAALAAVPPIPELAELTVLPGAGTFTTDEPFPPQLADLVRRRVEQARTPLGAALPELARLEDAVVGQLTVLEVARPGLVHGDLIPANVLVDEDGCPTSVVDFGFLSTVGDPAFDAAVAASIFDMYGVRARETEAVLDAAFARRFGYEPERIALYRAAYALVTSNAYSASGSDGHFDWCVRMLQRPELLAFL